MKVLQVLPSLESGGVERGTLDFARELVDRGHESMVISSGGRLVPQLEQEGSRHICFAVHRKSLTSFFKVAALRKRLLELQPDVVHVRSRMPAWMVWLAIKPLPLKQRPALISTFHGMYSINRYSEIMGSGDQVIAISDCVRRYILDNYPRIDASRISLVHRGVDRKQFNPQLSVDPSWRKQLHSEYAIPSDKLLLLMPGRLSRWKGQAAFIELLAELDRRGMNCHGLVAGEPEIGKQSYLEELQTLAKHSGIQDKVSFLGHRSDMPELYKTATAVFNLSERPEPFGRTVIEALAVGTPVIAWDDGGPAESLRACFPEGLAEPNNLKALADVTQRVLSTRPAIELAHEFTLQHQADLTLECYSKALDKSYGAAGHIA